MLSITTKPFFFLPLPWVLIVSLLIDFIRGLVGLHQQLFLVWLKGGAILCYFLLFWGRRPHQFSFSITYCILHITQLSVDLLATYKKINDMFYAKRRKESAAKLSNNGKIFNEGFDDDGGNYVVQIGEEIAQRYIVSDILGKGSFGIVVKAHDHRRDENVALKMIKNKPQFTAQAKIEIDILSKLLERCKKDPEKHNIVTLKKYFTWKNHLCLVFELLSFNLYDLIKYTKFTGVSLTLLAKFAFQIMKTLEFLAQPPLEIIHCDLKPENILLKKPKRSGIKVCHYFFGC